MGRSARRASAGCMPVLNVDLLVLPLDYKIYLYLA